MDEGFDGGSTDTGVDTVAVESVENNIEPITDVPAEQSTLDLNTIEQPICEPELAELQNEAAALEIEPLDDEVDIGYDYDEAVQTANEMVEGQPYKPTAIFDIIRSGAEGASSPSSGTRIAGEILAPPGGGEVLAQGLQAGVNTAIAGSKGFMEAAHNQHAFPSAPLEGVDFIRNADGNPEPISPMVSTTNDNGEKIWVRHPNNLGKQSDG